MIRDGLNFLFKSSDQSRRTRLSFFLFRHKAGSKCRSASCFYIDIRPEMYLTPIIRNIRKNTVTQRT